MQMAEFGLRYGQGTQQNVNWSIPRRADVDWLAANGYRKSRLPIQWEMLQPMLSDTKANAATRAIIGEPGAFDATYQAHIQSLLDEHAAAGIQCVIDLHNYARYRDFRYQADGSVTGLVKPPAGIMPYTTDANQVYTRIFATAPGATLTPAHLSDFWVRIARLWKDHPGFGGYNLMNEPYNMPAPGTIVESVDDGSQDFTIWPAFAQAAIDAIRAIDPQKPIYVGGNYWSAAFRFPEVNPGFPLKGTNLIYEVHTYLDAYSNGQSFDWDFELTKPFTAGQGPTPLTENTGMNRLKTAVEWGKANNVKMALTETGMPVDDPRWQESFQRLANYARDNDVELYSWNGGNHWSLHNYGITHVPGWHENKTLEPQMSGVMKAAAGVAMASLFEDGPGYAVGGAPVTITVWSRGYLANPVTLNVSSSNGGSVSPGTITIPAGANTQATYTFTPAANAITTLNYAVVSGNANAPLARKVYSLTDPAAYAATSLPDAAMAILAKYGASKWDMADGHTDYLNGTPSAAGQPVRAVADSGYGSGPGNAMEMLNWLNTERDASFSLPVMRDVGGTRATDHGAPNSTGLWCRKVIPRAQVQPDPRNRMPYGVGDPHFAIAAVRVPGANSGIVFQASRVDQAHTSELAFANGRAQARWVDAGGATTTVTAPSASAANTPVVLTLACAPGAQQLRVNSQVAGTATASLAATPLDQMLIGWGYTQHYPRQGFGGLVHAVVTGRGAPSAAELTVLERYLGSRAGM